MILKTCMSWRRAVLCAEKKIRVLAEPFHNTQSAQGQASCAHDVFSKNDIEGLVRFMSSLMSREAHSHIFCLDFMFFIGTRASMRG